MGRQSPIHPIFHAILCSEPGIPPSYISHLELVEDAGGGLDILLCKAVMSMYETNNITIDQVHRVTTVIIKALEEKNYCCGVFLDVAQVFLKGLLLKLREQLPHPWCALLKSYLALPQGSVLGPILYLLYTADIPTNDNTMITMFADDTTILSTRKDQKAATEILQTTINTVYN
ncbi:Reverse transcriptase domain [Cinara cedri]|uniref:Reverse transcriptase domain n=1 Tax=Cinara cedri TaxID=506608 RepID=A0A5E4NM70_9HEMI|nr:Reverse transcriptase domain [Cinara cedri]